MSDVSTGAARALSADVLASCEHLARCMLRTAALPIDRHGVARPSSRRLYAYTCAAQVVTLRLLVSVGELRGIVFVAGQSFVRESVWAELVAELRAVLDGQSEAVWRALGVIVPTGAVLAELEGVDLDDDAVSTALDLLLLASDGSARDWSEYAIDDLIDALSALWTAQPRAGELDPTALVLGRSEERPTRSDDRAILALSERVAAWACAASGPVCVRDVHCAHGALLRAVLRQWAAWVPDRQRVVHSLEGLEAQSLRVALARLGLWWSAPTAIGDGRALEQRVRRIDRAGTLDERFDGPRASVCVVADLRGVSADVLRAAVQSAPAEAPLFFLIDRAWAEDELWSETRALFDQHAQREGLPVAVEAGERAPLLLVAARRASPMEPRVAPAHRWTVGPYALGAAAALVARLETLPTLRAHFSAASTAALDDRRTLVVRVQGARLDASVGESDALAAVRLRAHSRTTPLELLALLRSSIVGWQLAERRTRIGAAPTAIDASALLELAAPPAEASALVWDALAALGAELSRSPDDPAILARIDRAAGALYGLEDDALALLDEWSRRHADGATLSSERAPIVLREPGATAPSFAAPEGDARREAWAIVNASGVAGLSLAELCRRAREHAPDALAEAAQSLLDEGWLALSPDARLVAREVRVSSRGAGSAQQ